jgi:hypothetical protein
MKKMTHTNLDELEELPEDQLKRILDGLGKWYKLKMEYEIRNFRRG